MLNIIKDNKNIKGSELIEIHDIISKMDEKYREKYLQDVMPQFNSATLNNFFPRYNGYDWFEISSTKKIEMPETRSIASHLVNFTQEVAVREALRRHYTKVATGGLGRSDQMIFERSFERAFENSNTKEN